MSYQKTKELLNPILNVLNRNTHLFLNDIVNELALYFKLDENFLFQRYEVSNAKIFENTVLWKLNDLSKSGLIDFIKTNNKRAYIVSKKGISFLNKSNDEIAKYISDNYKKKIKNVEELDKPEHPIEISLEMAQIAPLEQLENSYKILRNQIYDDILDVVLSKSPIAFEHIVTQLLQKMGYGDGEVTQISRDGGIDARIKGDVLGFEQIYVQAKRYQRDKTISRQDIQSFIGALSGIEGNATKGVFITTAQFSNDAKEFAQKIQKSRIILIDGKQLAKYIYEYELGVQTEKSFSIKKIDNDFWNEFQNNE
ncbi:restriction endonuclease [Lonepinella koalarum]|uniref:restriction endonuclease n=1 Tax=Lonepinella koalarum TaxID=53417 RepID=UPI003F6E123C